MYRTDETVSNFVDEHAEKRARNEDLLDDIYPDTELLQANLRVDRQPGGRTVIEAPLGRDPKAIISLGLFVVIWMGGCVLVWNLDAPKLFPIFGGLCGLGLGRLWLDLLLNTSMLEIDQGAITFRTGWAGRGKTRSIAFEDIRNVKAKGAMSAGETSYPNIVVHLKSGEQVTVMRLVRGQPAGDRIVEMILEASTRG